MPLIPQDSFKISTTWFVSIHHINKIIGNYKLILLLLSFTKEIVLEGVQTET